MERLKGNKPLVNEIDRRFKMIRDAMEQMNRFNYGNACEKLQQYLSESLEIEVTDE